MTCSHDVVLCIEQAVNLLAACLQQCGQAVLGYFLFLDRLGKLPCDNFLHRLSLTLHKNALLSGGYQCWIPCVAAYFPTMPVSLPEPMNNGKFLF